MNIEYRIMNAEVMLAQALPSIFNIACSIFDIQFQLPITNEKS